MKNNSHSRKIKKDDDQMDGHESQGFIVHPTEPRAQNFSTYITTAGGGAIQGNVNIGGGDFVGRDKIIHGDEVHGDKITGNKIIYEQVLSRAVDTATLKAANAKLAKLPVDHIPPVAPLPTGSRMPFSFNPLFVGREEHLLILAATLKGDKTVAVGPIAAATGLGGIGKTQLAVAFVHHYGHYFTGGVYWLSFANNDSIPAQIAACGDTSGMELRVDYDYIKLDDQVHLVLAAWKNPLPRLLVFDNCEDPESLARWRPATGGSRVLVTSRRSQWEPVLGVHALPLGVLKRHESTELLRKFPMSTQSISSQTPSLFEGEKKDGSLPDVTGREKWDRDEATLAVIAEELGDLPLALHLAGSYLHRYRHIISPAVYLEQLSSSNRLQHQSLRQGDLSPTMHEQHVARTFALSYDRLDPTNAIDALALKLLARAAYFVPGISIPRKVLLASTGLDSDNTNVAIQAGDSLNRLAELGLIDIEAEGWPRLHRLLIYFLQQLNIDSAASPDVQAAILNEAYELNQTGSPATLLSWQPHLRYITEYAISHQSKYAAALCSEFGYHLWLLGDLKAAKPYYEHALAIQRNVLIEEHPDIASNLNRLGIILLSEGDLATAQLYNEQALAIQRNILGEQHAETANSLEILGIISFKNDKMAAAKSYFEQALSIRQTVLGEQHLHVADSLGNLGRLFLYEENFSEAQNYYNRALTIRRHLLGEQHFVIAVSLNNQASLLIAKLNLGLPYLLIWPRILSNAYSYLEQALVISRISLGIEHPLTRQLHHSLKHLKKIALLRGISSVITISMIIVLSYNIYSLITHTPVVVWSIFLGIFAPLFTFLLLIAHRIDKKRLRKKSREALKFFLPPL